MHVQSVCTQIFTCIRELRGDKTMIIYGNKGDMHNYYMMILNSIQALCCYGNEWIVDIKDITDFVREQHKHVKSGQLDKLIVARERVYPVTNKDVATQIGVDPLYM